jgi:hypothetical protein
VSASRKSRNGARKTGTARKGAAGTARRDPAPGCAPPAAIGVGSAAAAEPIVRWEDEGGMTPRDDAARAASPETGGKPVAAAQPPPPEPPRKAPPRR